MKIFTTAHNLCSKYLRRPSIDPMRDWATLLIVSAIALVGIIVWNVWAFDTVASGKVIGSAATSTPPIFNQDSLKAVNAVFEDRATEKIKYETGAYRFADPSQ